MELKEPGPYKSFYPDKVDYKILHAATRASSVQQLCNYLAPHFHKDQPTLTSEALLKRVQRRLIKLSNANFIARVGALGNPQLWSTTRQGLDLFSPARNSNSTKTDPNAIPVRCSEERKRSIKLLKAAPILDTSTMEKIQDEFGYYLHDVDDKLIILRMKEEIAARSPSGQHYLYIPYQTRFNSAEMQLETLSRYDHVWTEATFRFKRGVHLMLTTDPKRFKNLYEANRHFSIAFNRFISYLQKKLGFRPKYLSSYEYTKSGLMHVHCIIFGIPYLLPHGIITQEWERCGQGSYNYIYSLINDKGAWHYARQKPADLEKGQTAETYLRKHLDKGFQDVSLLYLYWAHNKRFFTHSRCLYTAEDLGSLFPGVYEFLMTAYSYDLPDTLQFESHSHLKYP